MLGAASLPEGAFPAGIAGLSRLQWLNIARCELQHVPSLVERLSALRILDLTNNRCATQICSIKDVIGSLVSWTSPATGVLFRPALKKKSLGCCCGPLHRQNTNCVMWCHVGSMWEANAHKCRADVCGLLLWPTSWANYQLCHAVSNGKHMHIDAEHMGLPIQKQSCACRWLALLLSVCHESACIVVTLLYTEHLTCWLAVAGSPMQACQVGLLGCHT